MFSEETSEKILDAVALGIHLLWQWKCHRLFLSLYLPSFASLLFPLCHQDVVWPRDYFSTFGVTDSRWHHLTLPLFCYREFILPAARSWQNCSWPPRRATGWGRKRIWLLGHQKACSRAAYARLLERPAAGCCWYLLVRKRPGCWSGIHTWSLQHLVALLHPFPVVALDFLRLLPLLFCFSPYHHRRSLASLFICLVSIVEMPWASSGWYSFPILCCKDQTFY